MQTLLGQNQWQFSTQFIAAVVNLIFEIIHYVLILMVDCLQKYYLWIETKKLLSYIVKLLVSSTAKKIK